MSQTSGSPRPASGARRSAALVASAGGGGGDEQTDSGAVVNNETEIKPMSECETGGKKLILQLEKLRVSKSNRFKMAKASASAVGAEHRSGAAAAAPFGRAPSALHPMALRKTVHHPSGFKREPKSARGGVPLKPSRLSAAAAAAAQPRAPHNDAESSLSELRQRRLPCKKCSPYASADTTNPYIRRFPCHCKNSRAAAAAATSEAAIFGSRASQALQDFSACCKEISNIQTTTRFRAPLRQSGNSASFTKLQSRAQKRVRGSVVVVVGGGGGAARPSRPHPQQQPAVAAGKSSCAQQARETSSDVSVDDLAGYLDNMIFPKKMSYMAEMMYT